MTKIAIVYHSGYGHTAAVAEAVKTGAASVAGTEVGLYKADDLADPESGPWDALAGADAIIFGAPTYMGSVSAPMKHFMDASSKVWFSHGWKDKIAAGFTNSGSLAGDKQVALQQLSTLAAQHAMIWVGTDLKSGYNASGHDFGSVHNRAGHFLGLGTQALTDLPGDQSPDQADRETAELFGKRVATVTAQWVKGRA